MNCSLSRRVRITRKTPVPHTWDHSHWVMHIHLAKNEGSIKAWCGQQQNPFTEVIPSSKKVWGSPWMWTNLMNTLCFTEREGGKALQKQPAWHFLQQPPMPPAVTGEGRAGPGMEAEPLRPMCPSPCSPCHLVSLNAQHLHLMASLASVSFGLFLHLTPPDTHLAAVRISASQWPASTFHCLQLPVTVTGNFWSAWTRQVAILTTSWSSSVTAHQWD